MFVGTGHKKLPLERTRLAGEYVTHILAREILSRGLFEHLIFLLLSLTNLFSLLHYSIRKIRLPQPLAAYCHK
jgi:hypothetical protein